MREIEPQNPSKRASSDISQKNNLGRSESNLTLNFRCPTCTKLYEVDSRQIKSSSPHFDCLVCGEVFTFAFPPIHLKNIETRVVNSGYSASHAESKSCPKCSALNPISADECGSCQIVFKNYEILQDEAYPNARPSLVMAWKDYIQDYQNFEKREKFIQQCVWAGQLDYAEAKLRSLQQAMGVEDPHCQAAMKSLEELKVQSSQPKLENEAVPFYRQKRALYLGPVLIACVLVLIGIFNPFHRNMIGPGVAIFILHMGLIFMIKGRISLADFTQK